MDWNISWSVVNTICWSEHFGSNCLHNADRHKDHNVLSDRVGGVSRKLSVVKKYFSKRNQ